MFFPFLLFDLIVVNKLSRNLLQIMGCKKQGSKACDQIGKRKMHSSTNDIAKRSKKLVLARAFGIPVVGTREVNCWLLFFPFSQIKKLV